MWRIYSNPDPHRVIPKENEEKNMIYNCRDT
jgi:hypothetical protein